MDRQSRKLDAGCKAASEGAVGFFWIATKRDIYIFTVTRDFFCCIGLHGYLLVIFVVDLTVKEAFKKL